VVGAALRPGHGAGPGRARPRRDGRIGRRASRSRLRRSLQARGGAPVTRLEPRTRPLPRLPVSRRAPFLRTGSPPSWTAERLRRGRLLPCLGPIQDASSDLLPSPTARLSLAQRSTGSTTCGRSRSEQSRRHRSRASSTSTLRRWAMAVSASLSSRALRSLGDDVNSHREKVRVSFEPCSRPSEPSSTAFGCS
jgi:hypothetical protein